ncbi:MAG: hypothetical protein ABF633_03245 [Clostridium sp.]|uniref:hypothetical protein n=1 Tax=Clostridium sp. TaxID=1506 RepID=UPI0039E88F9F
MNLQLFAESTPEGGQETPPATDPVEKVETTPPATEEPKAEEQPKTDDVYKSLLDKINSLEAKINEPKPEHKEEPKPAEEVKTDEKNEETPNADLDAIQKELNQAKTDAETKSNLVTEYEGILNSIIEAKLSEIPEDLKTLVPENLPLKEKLDWITKAEKTGIFKGKDTDIEIGKPLNPKDTKQHTDTSKMSASALMSLAYGNTKGKKK